MNKYLSVSLVILIFTQLVSCLYILLDIVLLNREYGYLRLRQRVGFHVRSLFFWPLQIIILRLACFDGEGTWKTRTLFVFSVIFFFSAMLDIAFLLGGGVIALTALLVILGVSVLWISLATLFVAIDTETNSRVMFDFSVHLI